jgi:hypothetical protein
MNFLPGLAKFGGKKVHFGMGKILTKARRFTLAHIQELFMHNSFMGKRCLSITSQMQMQRGVRYVIIVILQ